MPGLGQIYAGAPGRGLLVCCLWAVVVFAIFAVAAMGPVLIGALAPFPLVIGGLILMMVDAAQTARRAPRPFVLQPYQRWYVYVLLPLTVWVPIASPLRRFIKGHDFEAFKIPTRSMEPTILAGDYLYATRWRGDLDRGVNVVFRHDGKTFVKRVVGIQGDTLAMRSESLYVNRRYVLEPYAKSTDPTPRDSTGRSNRSNWGPIVVPPGTCFVLGDNRDNSLDSRAYGFVAIDSVIKQPIGVYFSLDPETHAIRWSRIGRDVRR